jgi:translation elongation factor EF-1beta
MVALEAAVRSLDKDGLVWGQSKLVAVGFGIKKLQINLVIEDDKIGLDDLQEEIAEFEDYVQSSDVVSFAELIYLNSASHQWLTFWTGCYAKAVDCLTRLCSFPTRLLI